MSRSQEEIKALREKVEKELGKRDGMRYNDSKLIAQHAGCESGCTSLCFNSCNVGCAGMCTGCTACVNTCNNVCVNTCKGFCYGCTSPNYFNGGN